MTLFGLVMAGGKSRRMQQDKSQLKLQQQSLVARAYRNLDPLCQACYVSVSKEQLKGNLHADFPRLPDNTGIAHSPIGPMGGILTAQASHPDATWLVLACDLPLMPRTMLKRLVEARNPATYATLYRLVDKHNTTLQPLCGLYEPSSHTLLTQAAKRGDYSLQHTLARADIDILDWYDPKPFTNLNTPADYARVLEILKLEPGATSTDPL